MKNCVSLCFILSVAITTFPQPVLKSNPYNTHQHYNKSQDEVYKILFVGNSLTYYNDLPALVQDEAKARGIEIHSKMLAKSNYAIVDHWADGQVQNMIKTGNYDFVIIQQGPSSQQEGRNMLIEGGKLYSQLCKEYDTKLAFFMVWPSRTYFHTFDSVIANYTEASEINGALLCPVGLKWKEHIDQYNDYSYYSADGFHPSVMGSKVASRAIINSLFPSN